MIEFKKITDFPRGTIYDLLKDAYSYDKRNQQIWDGNWKETDDFFYDNPPIADKYGLVTCIDEEPIGFITWDPRNRLEYVEIGLKTTRTWLASVAKAMAQIPFHGYVEGEESNLEPIVRLFPK